MNLFPKERHLRDEEEQPPVRSHSAAGDEVSAVVPIASDESRLIQRVADGDLRAFENLYRIYHPRLTRFIANMVRKPELVEEVVNDTLLVVWRKPDGYNGASKVSTCVRRQRL